MKLWLYNKNLRIQNDLYTRKTKIENSQNTLLNEIEKNKNEIKNLKIINEELKGKKMN